MMADEPETEEFFQPVEITAGNYIYLKQEADQSPDGLIVMTRDQARTLAMNLIAAVGPSDTETAQ